MTLLLASAGLLAGCGQRSETGPDAEEVADLLQLLKEKDDAVRKRAVNRLGKIGPEAEPAVPILVEALSDEDWLVRANAVVAISRIGTKSEPVVTKFIEALKDEHPEVRYWSTKALAVALGWPDRAITRPYTNAALRALRDAQNDEDASVRLSATKALKRLAPSE